MSKHQARLSDFWTVSKLDAAVNQAPTSSKPASTCGGPRPPGDGTLLCPPLHFSAATNHVYQAIGGGHQVNEGGNRHQTDYWAARQAKLDEQIKEHRERVESATAQSAGNADEGGSAAGRARSKIFSGLVFSIDGYTGPDVGDLKLRRLIVEHGGHLRFHFAVSRTTHVIATSLAGSKMHQALTTRRTSSRSAVNRACLFVTPTWILDSIAAGRRLPEADYLVVRDQTLGRATSARRSEARAGEDVVDTFTALHVRDSVARHASLRLSEGMVDKVATLPSRGSAVPVQTIEISDEQSGKEELRPPTRSPPSHVATTARPNSDVDGHERMFPNVSTPRKVVPVSFFQIVSHSPSPAGSGGRPGQPFATVAPLLKRSFFRDVVS